MTTQKEAMFLLEKFPYLAKPGFFIECGANDGIYYSIGKYFEDNYNWKGVNIECNPYCFNELVKNRPNCINLQYALSDKDDKKLTFNIGRNDYSGRDRLTGRGTLHINIFNELSKYVKEQVIVTTRTVSTIIKENNISKIDLFVLDVEGHEMSVLNTISTWSVLPKVFCIEFIAIDGRTETLKAALEPVGYKHIIRCGHNQLFELR